MPSERRHIRFSPTLKIIAAVTLVALFILLLRGLGPVIIPFAASAIITYLFTPLLDWLERRSGHSRALWVGVLYLIGGIGAYLTITLIGPVAAAQYRELAVQVPPLLSNLRAQIENVETVAIGGLPIDMAPFRPQIVGAIDELVVTITRRIPEALPHLVAVFFETMLLTVTYLMITFYALVHGREIIEGMYRLVPEPYRDEARWLGGRIDHILSGYVRGTLLLIPIMAVLTYIALTIMGVRYALVIAIFSGVVETVPLIGPWTAATTAMLVALFQGTTAFGLPLWLYVAIIGLIYFVLRIFEDNFIIPQVVGPAVHLHPMLVIFAILAGGALGGPIGLFISIPTAAVLRLLLQFVYAKLVDDPNFPPLDEPPPIANSHQRERAPVALRDATPAAPTQSMGEGEAR